MSDLNYRIDVNLLTSAPAVSAADFDNILLLSSSATFAAEYVRSYSSPIAVNADADLTAALKAYAVQLFAARQNPGKIKIGKAGIGVDYGADLDECLAEDPDFYCVTTDEKTQTELEDIAAWVGTNERLAILQSSDAAVKAGTPANVLLNLNDDTRTALVWHGTNTEAADLVWAAHKLSADPDSQATTWANLNLPGVAGDTLTDTERDQILGDDGNVYLSFKGVNCVYGGKTTDGTFIDTIVSGDWVKARIQEDIAQLLLDVSNRNEKIPYTDAGIAQIASLVLKRLKQGEAIGHFAPGSSNVVVPLLSSIASATIASRVLTLSGSAVFAGAIDQTVTVNLAVTAS
jgi:hypothetical protein